MPSARRLAHVSLCSLIFLLAHSACGGPGCFDSTYESYYTERELEEALENKPRVFTHTDTESRTLTLTLSYPDGYDGDYLERGYTDPPSKRNYNEPSIKPSASLPTMMTYASHAMGFFIKDAHSAIEPNRGNAISLKVNLQIEVVAQDGMELLSRSIKGVSLEYGKGLDEWPSDVPYEYMFLTTPVESPVQVKFLLEARDTQMLSVSPFAQGDFMMRMGAEVLYVSVDPDRSIGDDMGPDLGVQSMGDMGVDVDASPDM